MAPMNVDGYSQTGLHGPHEVIAFLEPETESSSKEQNGAPALERQQSYERSKWGSKQEYILSTLGYCVGVGNLWRFPYVCIRNGGGAFLIPFMLSLIIFGMPLFFLETYLGQFTSRSPLHVWSICPLFKGVGVAMCILALIVYWYYNTIMAWALYYLVSSFQSTLPWHNVLQVSSGFGEMGHVVWYIALSLGVSSIFLFLGMIKGIKSSGKVVYVTATAPYILLTVLLIRGATLPGAVDGIIFYLRPDFSRLTDVSVWVEAALQVFWSLGPCWGSIIAMASYNQFTNNCMRDSIFLTLACEGTSIYAGFAIFSVLGYMARESGVPVDKVVSSGGSCVVVCFFGSLLVPLFVHMWTTCTLVL
ncbi:hypothetical protein ACOMHN_006271 [Nucella lapillus]